MPNAMRIFGWRGTPFGAPVVPEVNRTIRPARATLGRESPWRAATPAASTTVTPSSASCACAANSLSQITIPIRWLLSADANDSVRKSVLSSTTSAPAMAAAKTAATNPRPLRHKTPTACPGPAPRRCSSSASLCGPRTQFAVADRTLVVDQRCAIRPAGRAHTEQGDQVRASAGDLATEAEQCRGPRRYQQSRAQ